MKDRLGVLETGFWDDEADLEEEAAQCERERYEDCGTREAAYAKVVKMLENNQLFIAPEKVQMGQMGEYLGTKITPHSISPQKIELRKDHLKTLNDFQKLLGSINWIRPYIKMPNVDLQPLYEILKGDSQLTSPHALTKEARLSLRKVED